ncbi:MAG: hypothetical protein COB23_03520 [Methylophaga sp.]|nr:MAG: hypothetical protein COB23_03520 [Methylophaga sp.]
MNILLIEANQKLYESKGELNHSLCTQAKKYLSQPMNQVTVSCISKGNWNIQKEINKLKKADLIIYHFPLWWFGVPSVLKKYFDEVLQHQEVFVMTERYGEGGLLKGKKFMISVTSNMSKSDFGNASIMKEVKDIDEILIQLILTNKYIGIVEQLPTFHSDNVIKGDTSELDSNYLHHLQSLDL